MISIEQLSKVYAEKLLQTGDHQAAFIKAGWVAYKQGVADGNVGLPQTTEPGEAVAGPARGMDRELEAEELHQAVRPELPEVGNVSRVESYTSDMPKLNGVFGRATQLGPHHPPYTPVRLRFDRTTKLTCRTVQDKSKQG